jgi:hypothetical protein
MVGFVIGGTLLEGMVITIECCRAGLASPREHGTDATVSLLRTPSAVSQARRMWVRATRRRRSTPGELRHFMTTSLDIVVFSITV